MKLLQMTYTVVEAMMSGRNVTSGGWLQCRTDDGTITLWLLFPRPEMRAGVTLFGVRKPTSWPKKKDYCVGTLENLVDTKDEVI